MPKLDLPCFSPRKVNPGLSSIAMALSYLKAERKFRFQSLPNLEEEIYEYARESKYPLNSPESLGKIIKEYGKHERFTKSGTIEQIEDWLDGGFPVVLYGYFTPFGHIVAVTGYSQSQFLIHDSAGCWYRTGYRTDLPGSYEMDYGLIEEICGPDGFLWAHFISN